MKILLNNKNIIQKLVTNHWYLKDKDIEVISLLIEETYKNGTKVLFYYAIWFTEFYAVLKQK